MDFDFKTVKRDGTSADLEAAIAHLNREEPTAKGLEAQYEAGRKACLVDEDNDGAEDFERKLVLVRREIDRVAEQRRQLKVRLEEVLKLEAAAELDDLVRRAEAAQAKGLKAAATYEELSPRVVEALRVLEESSREINDANVALRAAGDARKVRLPVGLLSEKRGAEYRFDLAAAVRLPAVVGTHHFWPPVK